MTFPSGVLMYITLSTTIGVACSDGWLRQIERRLARVITPRHDELRDVVARDARKRRKPRASGIAAVNRPVAHDLGVANRSDRQ